MKPAKLFPMFLKLSARHCLVVGAGTIAESKITSLLEAGNYALPDWLKPLDALLAAYWSVARRFLARR